MFFAHPWSAAEAELMVLTGLCCWILLLIPGRKAILASVLACAEIAAPLLLAIGAYVLAFRTETILAHHEFLDLRTQSAVCALLLLASRGQSARVGLRRCLALFAVAVLILRVALPAHFVNGLRLGLLGLDLFLGAVLAAATVRGLIQIVKMPEKSLV